MELQWPLILFTTLVAWSAGLFASQCVLALASRESRVVAGAEERVQKAARVVSAALLVVGGIAVFFHLEHWERIFNGFGHLSSGITQELIAIVVLAVVAMVYLLLLRKNGGKAPAWAAAAGVVASAALVVVMAHSYLMAARPAWDTFAWVLYVLGNACVLGPLTMALLTALLSQGEEASGRLVRLLSAAGAAVNAVAALAYGVALQMSSSSFSVVGDSFDTTHPARAFIDAAAVVGDQALLVWGGAVVLGAAVPLICALMALKKPALSKACCALGVVCAVAGAICMRMAFYQAGLSVFFIY